MTHSRAKVFWALYLCAIVYLSLFPGSFALHPKSDRLLWTLVIGRRQVLDFVLNILFYIPLGASGCLALRGRAFGWSIAVLFGFFLSWTIEWLQLWTPSRYGNLTDLTSNTLGALIGATLAYAATRGSWFSGRGHMSVWMMPSSAWLLLSVWTCWQMFPFVPALVLARLTELPNLIAPWSWRRAAETFLGFAVLEAGLDHRFWLWIAFAALPAQAFLVNRALAPAALFGAVMAWAAVRLIGTRWLTPVLTIWLVYEEFRPFALADHAGPFTWAPFQSWYDFGSVDYYPTIFGKLFLYLAVVWSLRQRGHPYFLAAGIPGAILVTGEWAQRFLKGRTPETTDWMLLAAAAVLLKLSEFGIENEQRLVESQQ